MSRKVFFFYRYLPAFRSNENIKRASLKKGMKLIVKKPDCGIMMLATIWEPHEYANGHEGAQIELHFIKRGDLFYFTGIVSIP